MSKEWENITSQILINEAKKGNSPYVVGKHMGVGRQTVEKKLKLFSANEISLIDNEIKKYKTKIKKESALREKKNRREILEIEEKWAGIINSVELDYILFKSGIQTIDDLCELSIKQITVMTGLAQDVVQQIEKNMNNMGLCFQKTSDLKAVNKDVIDFSRVCLSKDVKDIFLNYNICQYRDIIVLPSKVLKIIFCNYMEDYITLHKILLEKGHVYVSKLIMRRVKNAIMVPFGRLVLQQKYLLEGMVKLWLRDHINDIEPMVCFEDKYLKIKFIINNCSHNIGVCVRKILNKHIRYFLSDNFKICVHKSCNPEIVYVMPNTDTFYWFLNKYLEKVCGFKVETERISYLNKLRGYQIRFWFPDIYIKGVFNGIDYDRLNRRKKCLYRKIETDCLLTRLFVLIPSEANNCVCAVRFNWTNFVRDEFMNILYHNEGWVCQMLSRLIFEHINNTYINTIGIDKNENL